MSQTSCEGKDKGMSPEILLPNCPFKFFLHLPLKYLSPITLRNWTGGGWIPAVREMTVPLIPSKTCLAAFTSYTRYFMIPLNSKLLSCFPAIWACYTTAFPGKSRVQSRAAPGAAEKPAPTPGILLLSSHPHSNLSATL